MIRDWRRAWGEGDFPFLYVQLANWGVHTLKWRWPDLREAQSMALSLPKTGMAVTIDIGDGSNIHLRISRKLAIDWRLQRRELPTGATSSFPDLLTNPWTLRAWRSACTFSMRTEA